MDAVESVGFRCDARILALNSYENRVYQIGMEDDAPIIGKFYRPNRWTTEQILEEHAFTLELAASDLSVVAPMTLATGSTLFTWQGFEIALFPRMGGRAPAVDDLACLEILGRFIARLHNLGAAAKFEYRPSLSLEDYGIASRQWLLENKVIPMELLPAYESVSAGLLDLVAQRLADFNGLNLRLHADCHMGNVLWRDDQPHFVDFDDARTGPAIQDLWMLLSGDEQTQSQQMSKILKGYRDFRDFDPAELRLIEALRTLRIMHHAAWLARRWSDPAFPLAFPFFNTQKYWSDHILDLREQWAAMEAPTLQLFD